MLHRLRRFAACAVGGTLLFAAAAVAASPSPAPAAKVSRATFGIGPATATALDKRLYLNYVVTPGAMANDHVVVVNYSSIPLTLRVYATDALNDDKGGFALLEASKPAREAGTWIAIGTRGGTGRITLPPRARAIVPVRIHVSGKATPGDHAAGIVASLSTIAKNAKGVNVQLDQRVATRVYFRVSGAVKGGLAVRVIHVKYHDNWNPIGRGSADITYRVTNTGNVKLGGDSGVSVRGWLGIRAKGPKQPTIPLLLPGGSVTVVTHVKGVFPVLFEHAHASVSPTVLLGDSDPGLQVYSGARFFWAVPWTLIATLIAFVYLLRRYLRRQSGTPRHGKGGPAPAEAPVESALQDARAAGEVQ